MVLETEVVIQNFLCQQLSRHCLQGCSAFSWESRTCSQLEAGVPDMEVVWPTSSVSKHCCALSLQPTFPPPVRMPKPNTTSRTVAPCCLHTRPQITGFFIQSLQQRGIQQKIPSHTPGNMQREWQWKRIAFCWDFIFCPLSSSFPSENVAPCSRML